MNPKHAKDELDALKSLKDADGKCNYLIELLKWFEEDSLAFLVYPVYGPNTKVAMEKNNQPFKMQDVQIMAKQLIEATNFLHKNKMLHTDIKTANILLNRLIVSCYIFYSLNYICITQITTSFFCHYTPY